MESEQRGRASRASSTSSLGREVRCGCQYYQSDSLLPERRALLVRPSSRTMQQPPAVRCSEHEYEPIAPPSPPPSLPHPAMAPVVRITDTDVMPVADSDDSIDELGRLPPELILDGSVVLPLDGKIEDSAMEGRELGETGDTSAEELEPTAQQLQDRLEERFLDVPTPYTESRTDGEINTSQVDSSTMEELPLRRGARGLPQRLKNQAGKLRSRLRSIQRPTFSFPQKRQKPDKTTTTTTTTTTTKRSTAASSGKSDKSRTPEKRPSRIERIRTSISEKTGKFSLPDRPRFSLPDKSKFHLPERPKFNFPDKSRFHLPDKSKFSIKKPNIRLPSALTRVKRPPSLREQQQQRSTESTSGSKRNIFDFATYPRIFDKKSKKRGDYATSSPKDSRTESAESATLPRVRKGKTFSARWTSRFGDSAHIQDQDRPEDEAAASDGSPPWHQSSTEEPPRLSARTEEEILAAARAIPWEDARKREQYDDEEIQYMDYEQESSEISDRRPAPPRRTHKASRRREESYEREEAIDPGLYNDQATNRLYQENDDAAAQDEWRVEEASQTFKPIPRSRSLDEDVPRALEQEEYDGAFMAVDPRQFDLRKMSEEEQEEELEEGEEEHEPSSMQSDREQQASSGSSCDRRRRGVIEEIDSDEFFLRASGISQDDVNLGNYLTDEIRDALRSEIVNALQDDELPPTPPQRPTRTLRKRKENSAEPDETAPPVRPKRERSARRSREASIVDEVFRERTRSDSRSDSRHLVVYQTEGDQREMSQEPLDDIVVVKPARRKSRSSLRSQSQPPLETILSPSTPFAPVISDSFDLLSTPPVVPVRRKRSHRQTVIDQRNGDVSAPICNGHHEWETEIDSKKPMIPTRSSRSRLDRHADGDILVVSASREDIEDPEARLQRQDSVPVAPKRRSRSRTTSVAADEDRTSHGAESLPEAGYIEEDIPREDESGSARDLSGYAIVEKREKPPKLPPPRRRRGKFATTPRPIPPKRPQRAYSTLGPVRTRDTSVASEPITRTTLSPAESEPYIEIDADDTEHRDLRSGEVLNKMQGRPLPAPPRPPRSRKEHVGRPRTPFEYAEMTEVTAATQTDPLPDDMVIEEEITQAKLIVTPSRSGSQVLVSMERIPSPSRTGTPPVPPLPIAQFLRKEEEEEEEEEEVEVEREMEDTGMAFETVSLTSPSPMREPDLENKHRSAPHLQERIADESPPRSRIKSSLLLPDEPLRVSTLEVGDLKVDRLSVSQIEAHKIVASEIDAMMITASELRGGDSLEESLSPAIIRELIAIRSHLETVAQERQRESEKESASRKVTDIPTTTDDSQIRKAAEQRESSREAAEPGEIVTELSETVASRKVTDIPTATDDSQIREAAGQRESSREAAEPGEVVAEFSETVASEPASAEDETTKADEDEKVVKTDVIDLREQETSHIPTVAQTKDSPPSQILKIDKLESKDADESIAHLHTVAPDIQDKSLRILDPEHPLTLTPRTTSDSHVDESRASYPSSDVPSTRPSESRVSPERAEGEPPSSSVQTATTATATELGATSTGLRGSKDDAPDSKEPTSRKSKSRSPSPTRGMRQTASPVRSLPPVISVTPDTPDSIVSGHGVPADAQPQRAVISYFSETGHGIPTGAQPQRAVISHFPDLGQALRERQRESSQSPTSSLPPSSAQFIAFPVSEIPAHFFSLSDAPTSQRTDSEPGVIDTTQQLLRALRLAGIKAMRHFVGYLTSTLSADDTREKVREVEIVICALLLLIAGLLIYYFGSTRTVTHYHHWDYFNPPQ